MERDKLKDPAAILAARPNGRTTAPLVVNRNGPRRSLFTSTEPKGDRVAENAENLPLARPVSSASSSDRGLPSPRNATKIPRPAQQPLSSGRKPFSLTNAYRMAAQEEDDAVQGSPSPAPRSWRSRTTAKENQAPNSPSQRSPKQGWRRRGARTSTESLGQEGNRRSVESFDSGSQRSDLSESDIDQKLKQFEQDQLRLAHPDGRNIFSVQKLGPKVTETGTQLARKASNGSLDGASPSTGYQSWGTKAQSRRGWLKRVVASPDTSDGNQEHALHLPGARADRRSPSPVRAIHGRHSPPPTPISNALRDGTPNKSFAWQADEDFTAGDLQVSESPPVKAGIASQPAVHEQASDITRPNSRNTKLDEIRALEIEAALKFPDEPPGPPSETDRNQEKLSNEDGASPQGRHLARTNTKIDEIRAREIDTLSRRALATARLDEIRERNAESRSRSSSPEFARKPSKTLLSEPTPLDSGTLSPSHESNPKNDGEQIPNTPITIFKKSSSIAPAKVGDGTTGGSSQSSRGGILRNDSHDLLRQLARAASTSPASEPQVPGGDVKDIQRPPAGSDKSDSGSSRRERKLDKTLDDAKPRVGFAGLRREPSMESTTSDKRSSFAASDSDPTERIERELQLFAPTENHSERGSLRAPSPDLEEECPEETPRPPKPDPLTQPTPRVTGAYVETPATTRVEKVENPTLPEIIEPELAKPLFGDRSLARGRRAESSPPRKPVHSLSAKGDRDAIRSTSLLRGRRSKSLPRVRSPLINTARPPTVKDDLLEIRRTHQIEDDTLDDFSELLPGQGEDLIMAPDDKMEVPASYEEEQQAYARMTKSLNAGLDGIKTAKRGIERLQDKVSHAETLPKPETPHVAHANHTERANCPICLASGSHSSSTMVAYIHLPVPRLWRRQPHFQFTILGLVVFLLSCWYVAESTMCFYYCKPESCYPGQPCDWSHDDPFWGYSIPIKLDQWTTGGQGRALARQLGPDIADWKADLWDAITGTDFTKVDTTNFDWDRRKQHRRRLMKRGLIKPLAELPEDRAKHEAWRAAAAAKERADAMREMGYNTEEDESMTVDEKVHRW